MVITLWRKKKLYDSIINGSWAKDKFFEHKTQLWSIQLNEPHFANWLITSRKELFFFMKTKNGSFKTERIIFNFCLNKKSKKKNCLENWTVKHDMILSKIWSFWIIFLNDEPIQYFDFLIIFLSLDFKIAWLFYKILWFFFSIELYFFSTTFITTFSRKKNLQFHQQKRLEKWYLWWNWLKLDHGGWIECEK